MRGFFYYQNISLLFGLFPSHGLKEKKLIKRLVKNFGFEIHRISKRNVILDLSKVELIRNSSIDELRDIGFTENLLLRMGLNNEILSHYPEELYQYTGYGLFSWQYPNQFSRLLVKLSEYPIQSYLEIGARHGGTFIIMYEYLRKFNPHFDKAIAVDIIKSDSLVKFTESKRGIEYLICSSQSFRFRKLMEKTGLDLVLIDGDHSLEACKNDFELVRDKSKMLIFHDISSVVCPGVCATWLHFKSIYKSQYDFFEFTDQYEEVYQRTGNSYLGIGLAIKKS